MTNRSQNIPDENVPCEGSFAAVERDQLRVWSRLSLRQKLEALDEMCDHARRTIFSRKKRGLPYIDPFTGEAVSPAANATVNEDPPRTGPNRHP
jgi:hypothetical protein